MKYFILTLLLCLSIMQAETLVQTASKSTQITNWDVNLDINKFNSSLGTLNYVTFTVKGDMTGDAKFENVSTSSGGTLDWTLKATLTLKYGTDELVIATPGYGRSDTLTTYDGSTDYAGTSGRTYTGLSATDTKSANLFAPVNDLSPFIGAGTYTLNLAAVGAITLSGYSNVQNLITTHAAGYLTVTYGYTVYEQGEPSVPEPASLLILSCGIFAIVTLLRKK